MNGNELKDRALEKVVGGLDEARAKHLKVRLTLPTVDREVEVLIYVDGVLDGTDHVNPAFVMQKTYTFNGTHGKKDVRFKADGQLYAVYELDFDARTITQIV